MERSPSFPAARGLALAGLAFVLAIPLALKIVSVGFAADSPPALGWRPSSAAALSAAAEQALTEGRTEEAVRDAQRAIVRSPIEASAFRVLAQATAESGDARRARDLMGHAGSLTKRDTSISYWLYHAALDEGRYAEAFLQADTIMRRAPSTEPLLVSGLVGSLSRPGAAGPLAARLASSPPWRGAFFKGLGVAPPSDEIALSIIREMRAVNSPAGPRETTALLTRIARDRGYAAAYEAWVSVLPPSERPSAQGVYDERFQRLPGPTPFGWQGRAAIGDGGEEGDDGVAGLQVRADGFADSEMAFQMLMLNPGHYRLISRARRMEGEDADLEWRLSCIGPASSSLLRTPFKAGSGGMDEARGEFEVSSCPVQRLALWSIGADVRRRSDILVTDVRIEPLETAP